MNYPTPTGLGSAFYSFVDRLKTTPQPLVAFVPEVFQMHQQVTFQGNRAELTWIWSGDYTTHILKLSLDGQGSRDKVYPGISFRTISG
jgi:hypothetical protein